MFKSFFVKPKSQYHITTKENAEFAVEDFLQHAAERTKDLPSLTRGQILFLKLYRHLLFWRWGVKLPRE